MCDFFRVKNVISPKKSHQIFFWRYRLVMTFTIFLMFFSCVYFRVFILIDIFIVLFASILHAIFSLLYLPHHPYSFFFSPLSSLTSLTSFSPLCYQGLCVSGLPGSYWRVVRGTRSTTLVCCCRGPTGRLCLPFPLMRWSFCLIHYYLSLSLFSVSLSVSVSVSLSLTHSILSL